MLGQRNVVIHPISNYSFGTKDAKVEKDNSVAARIERLKEKYAKEGIRRSVDAVIVVHEHGHPHILLMQVGTSFFKLPGGRLRPGESEIDGVQRKLQNWMGPTAEHLKTDFRIVECIGTYYRPNFENIFYPYCPPHIARPKEIRHIFLIELPERCYFAIPRNFRLVAVPLFEMYDHTQRYGPVIASIPQLLSRFNLIMARDSGVEDGGAVQNGGENQQHGNELMVDFD